MSNPAGRTTDWAEDDEPDLATALPQPQITKNKDGTETVVTYSINEKGQKIKRTQRIRRTVIKKRENPRVAERRAWPKMGIEAGRAPGPHPDTTTLGENIIFRPVAGFKSGNTEEKEKDDKKADALKKMQIKCRICSGDHFTTKCPFRDTMAPEGEAGAGAGDGMGGEDGAEGGLGAGGSSYVPPHLRKGAGATGERMGGKYERDDLATLRVTNVSTGSDGMRQRCGTDDVVGQRVCRGGRAQSHVRALRPCHPCFPGQGQRDWKSKGFRFRQLRRQVGCRYCVREDGRLRFPPSYSARRVCEEVYLDAGGFGRRGAGKTDVEGWKQACWHGVWLRVMTGSCKGMIMAFIDCWNYKSPSISSTSFDQTNVTMPECKHLCTDDYETVSFSCSFAVRHAPSSPTPISDF